MVIIDNKNCFVTGTKLSTRDRTAFGVSFNSGDHIACVRRVMAFLDCE